MSSFHVLLSQNDLPADENNVTLTDDDDLAKTPNHELAKWLVEEVALKRFPQKFLYAMMGKRLKPGKKYKQRKSGRDILIRYGGDCANQTRATFNGRRKKKKSFLVYCSLAFHDRKKGGTGGRSDRLALLVIDARTVNKIPCDLKLEAEVNGEKPGNSKGNTECSKKTKVARTKVSVGTNVWLAKSGSPTNKSPLFAASPSSVYSSVCQLKQLHKLLSSPEEGNSTDIIMEHFGDCPVFKEVFCAQVSSGSSEAVIEEAYNLATRHLCHHRCFLRAHHPVREFCKFWRDITIRSDFASNEQALVKSTLLEDWTCSLVAANPPTAVYSNRDGRIFQTRSKAVMYLNDSETFASLQERARIEAIDSVPILPQCPPIVRLPLSLNKLFSPLGLIEELYLTNPWRMLISTIFLHVTTRSQIDRALFHFFKQWPDAKAAAEADWEEILLIIESLGLGNKRSQALVRFSREFIELTEENDEFSLSERQVKSLHFIGEYGWSAYRIFILKDLPLSGVKDHALSLYVEYQLGCATVDKYGIQQRAQSKGGGTAIITPAKTRSA